MVFTDPDTELPQFLGLQGCDQGLSALEEDISQSSTFQTAPGTKPFGCSDSCARCWSVCC